MHAATNNKCSCSVPIATSFPSDIVSQQAGYPKAIMLTPIANYIIYYTTGQTSTAVGKGLSMVEIS